jgi:hypothetical protein
MQVVDLNAENFIFDQHFDFHSSLNQNQNNYDTLHLKWNQSLKRAIYGLEVFE